MTADIRFALRALRRSPLFAAVAVLSLSLGIGANTAIFTLIDQILLRLLPVKDPERLVMIWSTGPHMGNNRGDRAASYPMYQDFQKSAPAFSHVFARFRTTAAVAIDGGTERVSAELVSGNYFQALGVRPAVGRVFTPEQDDRFYKGHPAVVLSHDYWVARFQADPKVVGRSMRVNDFPMTVVGVSAPGFTGLDRTRSPQIRVPIQMKPILTPGWDQIGDRRSQWIQMFARLKPGYTPASAQASLQPLFTQIIRDELQKPELSQITPYYRERFLKRQVQVEPAATGYSEARRQLSTALLVLMAMVGLVLLIACSNVANLLIARAAARRKEVAVRLAIGASRAQLLRQLLTESVILSLIGGAAGLAVSYWMLRGLMFFVPRDGAPFLFQLHPDWRILGFTFALTLATGLLFGMAPALQATKLDLWGSLKDVVGAIAGGGSVRLRKSLVVAQVALSFLLLAGSGLFVKSLSNLRAAETGFRDIANLVTFQIDPALNGYSRPRIKAFQQNLLTGLRALPGAGGAAYATVALLHGNEWDSTMSVQGYAAKDGEDMQAFVNSVSPGYFATMGVPLLEGRDFRDNDTGERFTLAIVNRKFARHYFGDQSPIGRRIAFGGRPKQYDIEIVGMVEDSLYEGPREGVRRQVFFCDYQSRFPASAAFYVRASAESKVVLSQARQAVARLDGSLPLFEMKTLEAQLDETLVAERLVATLSAAFGALATLLASIGLYGVMAFVVTRRTKEIGLRMALGAQRGSVVWLVMKEVLLLLVVGLALGYPAAWGLSRYVQSQLFEVQPTDLATAAIATSILAFVAVGAGWIPARRASAIDPQLALRYE